MPIENVPKTDLKYYLITFNAEGQERDDDPDGQMSQRVKQVLATEAITDVFILAHGWRSDVPAARRQYGRWIKVMLDQQANLKRMRRVRPNFNPLLIGLHWPSQPWGTYDLLPSAISYRPSQTPFQTPVNQLVDQYAERLVDTFAARQALDTILSAAHTNIASHELSPAVEVAYYVLNYEMGLESVGVGAAPDADREPFHAETTFEVAKQEALSFGGFSWGGVLSPLRTLSFWAMKDRARKLGEGSGFQFLLDLQEITTDQVRFHLIGHSFGCIVVSGMLAGEKNWGVLKRPINSLILIQGALSHWSFCPDIPVAPGVAGYFYPLINEGKISGPMITTHSRHDTALGKWYPLAAAASSLLTRSVSFFGQNQFPMYGALGAFGAQGGEEFDVVDLKMLRLNADYSFKPQKIYNLDGSQFIYKGSNPEGAHNDITQPPVAHAVWQAVMIS